MSAASKQEKDILDVNKRRQTWIVVQSGGHVIQNILSSLLFSINGS